MVIGAVTLLVGSLGSVFLSSEDNRWFFRLRRPDWLVFEKAIPVIWTVVFICAAWSAYWVWEADPGTGKTWALMGFYLCLELVTMSYTVVMCKLKSLRVGVIIGGLCVLLGLLLALTVRSVSVGASWLLLPYILWSPIGTYVTWAMLRLNPLDK